MRTMTAQPDENLIERGFGRLADAALMASVFVVPCFLGGRIAWGQFALATCAVTAALSWSAAITVGKRPSWAVTWVEPLLLAIVGLGLFQITPLPPALLHFLSPHHQDTLPLWSAQTDGGGALGEWHSLSLNLGETRSALIVGLSYVALFYVATQRIRRLEDVERMLRWIAGASAAMALFGVVQWLSNNGKFFWFYEYPLTNSGHRLKGAFTNRNHFAQFLVLGCGPLLWWILKLLEDRATKAKSFGTTQASTPANDTLLAGLLLSLGVMVFGVLFSLSRGGMLALSVSLLVMLGALFRIGVLSGRLVGALLGMVAVCGSLFLMLGYDKVTDRLDNWRSDSRLAIWQANLQIAGDFPLFGTGVGSHVESYPMYYAPPFAETEFTHAESSYLQVASEAGLFGLGLAVVSWGFCAAWCWRSLRPSAGPRVRVLAAAVTASLAANAFHAFFDFLWYVPALMNVVLLLAACVRRLDQLSPSDAPRKRAASDDELSGWRSVPRGFGLLTGGATLCLAMWSYPQLLSLVRGEKPWFDYLRLTLQKNSDEPKQDEPDFQATEPDPAAIAKFRNRVTALNQTTKLNPEHARAHLRLATCYRNAFEHLQRGSENPMTLAQLRDAVLASQFESVESMREWLQRAVGSNLKYLDAASLHAKQAVRLCPLQGQAYVHLAELSFLENLDPKQPKALLTQAQLVRPHSAQVQFVLGREALQEGRPDDALAAWKEAFQRDRSYQNQILYLLAGTIPPDVVLKSLEPDLAALELMEARYRQQATPHYVVVARAYAEALKVKALSPKCDKPIDQLLKAAGMYAKLNETTAAESCFRRALDMDRASFPVRRAYGAFLLEQNQFAEATEYLEWCLRISPNDESLRRSVEVAKLRGTRRDSAIQQAGGYELRTGTRSRQRR